MKKLVRYSVIRFMPFSETQEFANVGIVIHAPQTGEVQFKLANTRFGRVSQFLMILMASYMLMQSRCLTLSFKESKSLHKE